MTAPVASAVLMMSVFDLCALLQAGGFVLSAQSRTVLSVSPRAKITASVATAITRHKTELLRLCSEEGPVTPHACRYCGAEFVSRADQDCRWCALVRGKPFAFQPNSPEERLFLAALDRRTITGKLCPTVPRTDNGQKGHSSTPNYAPPKSL